MSSDEVRPWSMRRQLSLRLTFALGAVLAVLFVATDYWIDAGAHDYLDTMLASQARSVSYVLSHGDPDVLHQLMPHYDAPGHTEFFTLYDASAHTLLTSSNSRGIALAPPRSDALLPLYYDLRTPDGHHGRALAVRLDDEWNGHLLVVATEREAWESAEGGIHSVLMLGIAATIVVVVGLVRWGVRGVFAPLLAHGERIATLDIDKPPQRMGEHLPSELKPFAAAFNTGIARLYGAVERERRFSRDIAHELRTPLAETRATAEVALRQGGNEALRNGLVTAIAATERMQRSVDTLLALARFESGQESPALDPLDLADLIYTQTKMLQRAADARNITLTVARPTEAWIHSDVGIIERILTNLLQNAIDYAPSGSAVNCRIVATDREYLVCIDNEAPELSEEDLVHLGTRFWRKPREGGTAQHAGLGLALSLALARSLKLRLDFQLHEARLRARLGPFTAL